MTITKEEMEIRRNTKLPPEYDVGYAQPPTASRFPPGVSGNPSGRPSGSKNKPRVLGDKYFNAMMRDEIYRAVPIEVGHDEDNATSTAVSVVARNLMKMAMAGHFKAAMWALERARIIEEKAAEKLEGEFEYAAACKARGEEAIRYARDSWQPIPHPVPHPDHIFLDYRRRTVTYTGPRNAEEKAEDDARRAASVEVSTEEAPAPEQAVELGDVADKENTTMVDLPEQKAAGEVIASTEIGSDIIQVPRAGTPACTVEELRRSELPPYKMPPAPVWEEERLRKPAA